jgi:ABC-2 type transport system ATP-binding protein
MMGKRKQVASLAVVEGMQPPSCEDPDELPHKIQLQKHESQSINAPRVFERWEKFVCLTGSPLHNNPPNHDNDPMIQVQNLRKVFGSKVAVDDVSFTVEKGQVLGFLGPNGAGKSTSMRMVTGYFRPTAGSIKVGGIDMLEEPELAKRSLGYLPENAPLYSDMTVASFLGFCAEMRGLNGAAKAKAIDRVLDLCFLHKVRNQSVDTLSKGYRHRTCFAQSIIHDPEILILDEPTDGLDPNQKHEIRNLIKHMGETKAIIFSTHILEEVEAACTRAMIIDRGKVVADGTPAQLKKLVPGCNTLDEVFRSITRSDLEK